MQRSVQRVRRVRGELLHGVQVRHGRHRSKHWQLPPERSLVADVRGPDSSTHSSADACADSHADARPTNTGPHAEPHARADPPADAGSDAQTDAQAHTSTDATAGPVWSSGDV
jgi:hypothetical protein